MKHDPLLNKQWDPPIAEQAADLPTPKSEVSKNSAHQNSRVAPRREKHPAISSRILATGISIAAVLGMSTAYTKAQKTEELQKLIDAQNAAQNSLQNSAGTNSPSVGAQSSAGGLPPAIAPNSTPTVEAPATTVAPQTTAPSIVQVPVQPAQPAQPAYTPPSQNRGNQSSGGSR